MRTLIPLEAMGKLDKFSDVFDLDVYRKNAYKNKAYFKANEKRIGFAKDIVDYCNNHDYAMPSAAFAKTYIFLRKCSSHVKKFLKMRRR